MVFTPVISKGCFLEIKGPHKKYPKETSKATLCNLCVAWVSLGLLGVLSCFFQFFSPICKKAAGGPCHSLHRSVSQRCHWPYDAGTVEDAAEEPSDRSIDQILPDLQQTYKSPTNHGIYTMLLQRISLTIPPAGVCICRKLCGRSVWRSVPS